MGDCKKKITICMALIFILFGVFYAAKVYAADNTNEKKGLVKINGSYYFYDNKGKMKTGWIKTNGNKYYFQKNKKNRGKALTGYSKVSNKYYKFKSNGKLVKKVSYMTYKASKISSPTKYLILVDKNTHKVGIYKGKKGDWKNLKKYSCTVGAASTPTPEGTFYIGGGSSVTRVTYFDTAKARCWYATRIIGNYFFHSVLYTKNKNPVTITSGKLGANLSHGCIRLKIGDAKWIYSNVPTNTKCIIY